MLVKQVLVQLFEQMSLRSYLAVLLGPNCLAGEAESLGFPQEAVESRHEQPSRYWPSGIRGEFF